MSTQKITVDYSLYTEREVEDEIIDNKSKGRIKMYITKSC